MAEKGFAKKKIVVTSYFINLYECFMWVLLISIRFWLLCLPSSSRFLVKVYILMWDLVNFCRCCEFKYAFWFIAFSKSKNGEVNYV